MIYLKFQNISQVNGKKCNFSELNISRLLQYNKDLKSLETFELFLYLKFGGKFMIQDFKMGNLQNKPCSKGLITLCILCFIFMPTVFKSIIKL